MVVKPHPHPIPPGQDLGSGGDCAHREIEHVAMDQPDEWQSVPSFLLAGRLWRVQREQQPCGCGGELYQGPGGTPPKGVVPRRVPQNLPIVRCRFGRTLRVGLVMLQPFWKHFMSLYHTFGYYMGTIFDELC